MRQRLPRCCPQLARAALLVAEAWADRPMRERARLLDVLLDMNDVPDRCPTGRDRMRPGRGDRGGHARDGRGSRHAADRDRTRGHWRLEQVKSTRNGLSTIISPWRRRRISTYPPTCLRSAGATTPKSIALIRLRLNSTCSSTIEACCATSPSRHFLSSSSRPRPLATSSRSRAPCSRTRSPSSRFTTIASTSSSRSGARASWAFRNILPDELYERLGQEPEPFVDRAVRFFGEDLVVRADGGAPMPARIEAIEVRARVQRDEVTGEAVPARGRGAGRLHTRRL